MSGWQFFCLNIYRFLNFSSKIALSRKKVGLFWTCKNGVTKTTSTWFKLLLDSSIPHMKGGANTDTLNSNPKYLRIYGIAYKQYINRSRYIKLWNFEFYEMKIWWGNFGWPLFFIISGKMSDNELLSVKGH